MNSRFSILMTVASMGILSACAASVAQETSTPQTDNESSERHFVIRGGRGDRQGMMLVHSDTDGDGRVSREEFAAKHQEKFDEIDSDDDGFLTDDEFSEFVSQRVNHAMHGFNSRYSNWGNNYEMSESEREEFEAEMEELEEEMEALGDEMRDIGREIGRSVSRSFVYRTHPDGEGRVESNASIEERIESHKDKAMEHMDKNSDGKISQEEYPGPDRRFARMDKDENGFISRDELKVRMHITREMDGFPPRMQERIFIKIDEDEEE